MFEFPYYKKVDISLLTWGLTIPWDYVQYFECDNHIRKGTRRQIVIRWGKKTYKGFLCNIIQRTRVERDNVYQLRYENDKELVKRLRKTFVQTFVATSTKKEEALIEGKTKTRTKLEGAQEILIVTPRSNGEIELDEFYRVENQWTPFLERLIENNVFPWLISGKRSSDDLYQKSTVWHDKRELRYHVNAENVIYYLADTNRKQIYVGKANKLSDRVKPGRVEIPGWNKFRYDIIRPQYAHFLSRIEENTIRTFASILKNKRGLSTLAIGDYTLTNKSISRHD